MKRSILRRLVYLASLLAVASVLGVGQARADEPDPNLKPAYGSITLKAGFKPDPFSKALEAGGNIKTKLGRVNAFISKAPDFRLNYTAGEFILRIFVEAKGDTTLLVNLPDGTWKANDDGGNGRNPEITFGKPQSGRYDIWVGTVGPKNVDNAVLKISEREAPGPAFVKAKIITLIDLEWRKIAVGPKKVEIRVYHVGDSNEIYKSSRTVAAAGVADFPWKFNRGAWAVTKKGVNIEFWEINSGIFQKDKRIGEKHVRPDTAAGVHSVNFDEPNYRYTLKYRIDN